MFQKASLFDFQPCDNDSVSFIDLKSGLCGMKDRSRWHTVVLNPKLFDGSLYQLTKYGVRCAEQQNAMHVSATYM